MSCAFCGNEILPGTGKLFVKKDGTVFRFCAAKCQRNQLGLGRVPRYVKWTKAFEKGHQPARAAGKPARPPRAEGAPAKKA